MATDTNVETLVLNRMTKAQYDAATKSTTELYLVPDSSISVYFGTSASTASASAKVATCSGFVLETGATIIIHFTYGNTHNGSTTLNVNGTGAKTIRRVDSDNVRYYWSAHELVQFVYDGTYWQMVQKSIATTSYCGLTKLSTSVSSTSTALAATPSAVKKAYDLANSKQDILTAGNNITISDNTISATDTTYSAGDGISITNNVISTTTQPFQYQVISEDNYQALVDAGTVDTDTLYFIKES